MPKETSNEKVLLGRSAVDTYREAHRKLHQKAYYQGVHDDHTPLLDTMLVELKKQGFGSIQEFFLANEEASEIEAARCYDRSGECKQCGLCCGDCAKLDKSTNLCTVELDKPLSCQAYPSALDYALGRTFIKCGFIFTKVSEPSFDLEWH